MDINLCSVGFFKINNYLNKNMFSGTTNEDLQIMIGMIIVSFVISLVVLFFTKKKILSFLIFSILANLSVYATFLTGSFVFRVHNLYWLRDFSTTIWPLINLFLLIILIINFIKNVKDKKSKK